MLMAYRGLATILLHVVILSYVVTPGVVVASAPGAQEDLTDQDPDSPVYTEEWVAHISGGERHARDVAQEHGFRFVRKLFGHDEHYLFIREDHPGRSKRSADHHTDKLKNDHRVHWTEQQVEKVRVKRGYIPVQRSNMEFPTRDELAAKQWYLSDASRDNGGRFENRDAQKKTISLDVVPVWKRGFTGKGVTVTVLDDGLEKDHPDLKDNYVREASYDLNADDPDPSPRYDPTNENKHGTRCAGEIAMVANNGICGVGVAPDAGIGGVRMLDGKVTDRSEAEAFMVGVKTNNAHVMSASWGPNDDGKTTEGPGLLASQALEEGVTTGRNGKGVIYVWASGNGGGAGDNCDCDGYTNSIHTLSISSASMRCKSPWYSEKCASTMATTYSSGDYPDASIVSADLHHGCTTKHSGTSAAAPLGAGVVALVLEANGALTWRDAQWVTMLTANYEALAANVGWKKNGACLMMNSRFGAGLMDGEAMIDLVTDKDWTTVPEKHICTNDVQDVNPNAVPQNFSGGEEVVVTIKTQGCRGQENEINYLEHVQVFVNISHIHRGNLAIYLKSPQSDNTTMLLSNRDKDNSSEGLKCWPFMSVHQWAENPAGEWQIIIQDNGDSSSKGTVEGIELVLHGTQEKPWVLEKVGCREYDQKAIKDAHKLLNDNENEQRNQFGADTDLFDTYMTSSSDQRQQQLYPFENDHLRYERPRLNQASHVFDFPRTKLKNDIEYSLDNSFHENGLLESPVVYDNVDPELLIRKNRIDRRFDSLPDDAFPPEIHNNDITMETNDQEYSQLQQAGSYGNRNYGNKLQTSDFGNVYGYEAYYKDPTAVLKPSLDRSNIDAKNYRYGTGHSNLNAVTGRYTYEGWKDYNDNDNDAKEHYDLNYLLRKIMG